MSPNENRPERPQESDLLHRAIVLSVGLHLAVFAALTLRAVFYPTEPMLEESAIRVDIVGLPDKVAALPPMDAGGEAAPVKPEPKKEEPKPEPVKIEEPKPKEVAKPAPKPEPVKTNGPTVNLDKNKRDPRKEQEAALKRMEALERLERMMKDKPSNGAASTSATKTQGTGAPIKGNALSAGSSLHGTARLDHENYKTLAGAHVHRHWNLPQWMANANFKARIKVFIDEQGNVVKKQLTQASGNQAFDERVLTAIESASPFPPPPGDLVGYLAVEGMEFGFPE